MGDIKTWLRARQRASHFSNEEPGVLKLERVPCERSIEAADHIEALESTLREIARTDDEGTVTHRLECRQRLARAVLEERGC